VVTEGQLGHEFYLLLSGSASVRRNGRKIATLGPGQYFGEMALLDRGPRSATIVIEEPAELLVIGQREFLAVLDQVPALAHKLLVNMAVRLREADTKALSH
jgi:CRP-like cAMP-binding protein